MGGSWGFFLEQREKALRWGVGRSCGLVGWISTRHIGLNIHLVRVHHNRVSSSVGAGRELGDGGRLLQSLLLAEWASPQLEHLAGEARQQLRMALSLPPLGHKGFGQRCSAFVCRREHRGHVGASALQSGLTWPYFQHV